MNFQNKFVKILNLFLILYLVGLKRKVWIMFICYTNLKRQSLFLLNNIFILNRLRLEKKSECNVLFIIQNSLKKY